MVHGHERARPLQRTLAHGRQGQLRQFMAGAQQQAQARGTALRLAILAADGQGTAGVMGWTLHGELQRGRGPVRFAVASLERVTGTGPICRTA
ncbi:hypothetical protein D3C78_1647190 [compost metagenome]